MRWGQLPVSDHILAGTPPVITRLVTRLVTRINVDSGEFTSSTNSYQLHYQTDDWNYILQKTIINYLPIRNQPDNISLIARQVFANLPAVLWSN